MHLRDITGNGLFTIVFCKDILMIIFIFCKTVMEIWQMIIGTYDKNTSFYSFI